MRLRFRGGEEEGGASCTPGDELGGRQNRRKANLQKEVDGTVGNHLGIEALRQRSFTELRPWRKIGSRCERRGSDELPWACPRSEWLNDLDSGQNVRVIRLTPAPL